MLENVYEVREMIFISRNTAGKAAFMEMLTFKAKAFLNMRKTFALSLRSSLRSCLRRRLHPDILALRSADAFWNGRPLALFRNSSSKGPKTRQTEKAVRSTADKRSASLPGFQCGFNFPERLRGGSIYIPAACLH